jgi:hypothetical protein
MLGLVPNLYMSVFFFENLHLYICSSINNKIATPYKIVNKQQQLWTHETGLTGL